MMLWWSESLNDLYEAWEYTVYKFYQYVVMLTVLIAYMSILILRYYQEIPVYRKLPESRRQRSGSVELITSPFSNGRGFRKANCPFGRNAAMNYVDRRRQVCQIQKSA
ncbi:unnamed protein product [Gongylonema pulchrum]|uniref:Copper transporter n=1 Tax=Gongylonema pulchrum TaxID=637853 RepID=A0A183DC76_9BILA|nr:unnamed protein product [Gongylonema pulchrum]